VMLTLIPAGLTVDDVRTTTWVKAIACVSVLLLLASSACLLRLLWLNRVSLEAPEELRQAWSDYRANKITGEKVRGIVANSFLGGPQKEDPISTSKADADNRAKWLKRSLITLLSAFVALGSLVVQIVLLS